MSNYNEINNFYNDDSEFHNLVNEIAYYILNDILNYTLDDIEEFYSGQPEYIFNYYDFFDEYKERLEMFFDKDLKNAFKKFKVTDNKLQNKIEEYLDYHYDQFFLDRKKIFQFQKDVMRMRDWNPMPYDPSRI